MIVLNVFVWKFTVVNSNIATVSQVITGDSTCNQLDGMFMGQPLPADDYWFVVTRQNGKEHKGHFTLKH